MPLKPTEMIKPQTGAVSVVAQFAVVQKTLPATISATNLTAAETVAIMFSVDGGENFEPLAQDGADLELTATSNVFNIQSPMLLGVTKSATVSASGVFIMTSNPAK